MSQNIFVTTNAVELALLSSDTKKQSKAAAKEFMSLNADKIDTWYDLPGRSAQQPIAEELEKFILFDEKAAKYPEAHAYLTLLEALSILTNGF